MSDRRSKSLALVSDALLDADHPDSRTRDFHIGNAVVQSFGCLGFLAHHEDVCRQDAKRDFGTKFDPILSGLYDELVGVR